MYLEVLAVHKLSVLYVVSAVSDDCGLVHRFTNA